MGIYIYSGETMISIKRVSDVEYDVEVTESKLVSARIPRSLYLLLEEKFKNKSEFIRTAINKVIENNIDLTTIRIDENRNKIITFRIEYSIYMKMIEHAQRYQSMNEFVNRAIWWGIENDILN